MDYAVHRILQARILEWVAIAFSIRITPYKITAFPFSYAVDSFLRARAWF